jgi:copper chaperone CopZ
MQKKQIVVLFVLVLTIAFTSFATAPATITIPVEGMHCGGCASSVEKKLKATEGVEEVRVSFEKKEAWIKYDDKKITVEKLREVINSTGFKAGEAAAKS